MRVPSLSRKDFLAGPVALLVVLVAAVLSNWSSLTSAITTSVIRNDLAHHEARPPVGAPPAEAAEVAILHWKGCW